MKAFSTLLFFFGLFALTSCGGEDESPMFQSPYIVAKDSFVAVLVDMHVIDAAAKQNIIENNAMPYQKHRQFKAILDHHNISKERFDSTVTYYSKHHGQYQAIYDAVIDSLSRAEKGLKKP